MYILSAFRNIFQSQPIPSRNDPALVLVPDVIYEIFQHLSVGEICNARMVCRAWSKMDWNEPRLLKVLKKLGMVFGKEEWNGHFGDVGAAPLLPPDIGKILWAPSIDVKGYKGKRVWESHLLTLIPAKIDGKSFCLDLLSDLIENPKQGSKTAFFCYPDNIKESYGLSYYSESHWVLMSRNVLDGSQYMRYEDQVKLVETYAKRTGMPYLMPNVLAATTCILIHYVRRGERLYSELLRFTRCQEKCSLNHWITVGNFFYLGIAIFFHGEFTSDGVGVAGFRKL